MTLRNAFIRSASGLYDLSREPARVASRAVGSVVALTPSGLITARAPGPEVVTEGTRVADSRGIVRGRVVRVFGPVASPYFSVRPMRVPPPAEGAALLGAPLVSE